MKKIFETIPNETLRMRIGDKIRQAILDGSLQEGQRLVERQLAAQFGTSSTAVREALIVLESEGFVTKSPNALTCVTKLSEHDTVELLEARRVLEVFAVERAASLATGLQVERLEERAREVQEAAKAEDPIVYLRKDFLLHELIWEMADNSYIQSALRRIALPYYGFLAIRTALRRQIDLQQDAARHLSIVDAIKSKQPETARKIYLSVFDQWIAEAKAYVLWRESNGHKRDHSESRDVTQVVDLSPNRQEAASGIVQPRSRNPNSEPA
jgi:DNA-binding GntR family transcriptional regulator